MTRYDGDEFAEANADMSEGLRRDWDGPVANRPRGADANEAYDGGWDDRDDWDSDEYRERFGDLQDDDEGAGSDWSDLAYRDFDEVYFDE